ncbi:MAG: hypothetical protein MJ193_04600 [Clostridia bacterium]|nr:hypothetical protein [Clostridia bacterium]
MAQNFKAEKTLWILLATSVVVMVFGFLFLFNAMGMASFYPHYSAIPNALAKYIVVILTMATGIMLFSNVAMRFADKKLRNGLTIFITAFSFILTVPLTYVLIAILPFAANHNTADILAAAGVSSIGEMTPDVVASSAQALNLNAIDGIMGTHNIYRGLADWFGEGAGLWVMVSVMMILGIVFLLEPLFAGICVVKGKILNIACKVDGKVKILYPTELPVLKKQREEAEEIAKHTAASV